MKLDELIINGLIYNDSIEGTLFFIPRKVEGKTIYGYSIYIPSEEDTEASMKSMEYVPKKGNTIYLGSIDRISAERILSGKTDLLRLSHFRNAEGKDIGELFRSLVTMKVELSPDVTFAF